MIGYSLATKSLECNVFSIKLMNYIESICKEPPVSKEDHVMEDFLINRYV